MDRSFYILDYKMMMTMMKMMMMMIIEKHHKIAYSPEIWRYYYYYWTKLLMGVGNISYKSNSNYIPVFQKPISK